MLKKGKVKQQATTGFNDFTDSELIEFGITARIKEVRASLLNVLANPNDEGLLKSIKDLTSELESLINKRNSL